MNFDTGKTPVEVIKKEPLEELILKIIILVLMINDTENHGKHLMSQIILTRNIIAKTIMTLESINIKLIVERH